MNERLYGKPTKEQLKKLKEKKKEVRKNPFEWPEIIDLVREDQGLSWYEITQMNMYRLKFLLDFISYKNRKKASIKKGVKRGK